VKICWDNLEKLRYSSKVGKWYKKSQNNNYTYFVYAEFCENCRDSFITSYNGTGRFCSKSCAASGENGNFYGKKHSEETKKKLSDINKGKEVPKWICKKISNSHKKRWEDPILCKEQSERMKKRYEDPVELQKLSDMCSGEKNGMYGKKHSEETRAKIAAKSRLRTGDKNPFFGKKHSEFTKRIFRDINTGPNNPVWKGDNIPYCRSFREELKWHIKYRDGWHSWFPGEEHLVDRLCVHHINYDKKDCWEGNLITLTIPANGRVNGRREDWQAYFEKIMELRGFIR